MASEDANYSANTRTACGGMVWSVFVSAVCSTFYGGRCLQHSMILSAYQKVKKRTIPCASRYGIFPTKFLYWESDRRSIASGRTAGSQPSTRRLLPFLGVEHYISRHLAHMGLFGTFHLRVKTRTMETGHRKGGDRWLGHGENW
jgi:hypothetical protein